MTAGSGACAKQNKVFLLTDNTVFYQLLSNEDGDWLHLIINETVSSMHSTWLIKILEKRYCVLEPRNAHMQYTSIICVQVKLHNECMKKFHNLSEKFSAHFGVQLKRSEVQLMELTHSSCIVNQIQRLV